MNEIVASAIFGLALVLIFADLVHRTTVALGGAAVIVIAGRLLGFFTENRALAAIDFSTVGLLLGMMVLVALLEPTGFFEYLALRAARFSRARPLVLFLLLGGVTSVLSMFLPNVSTVVAIAPVTLVIAHVLRVPAAPLLVSEAILSNIGGVDHACRRSAEHPHRQRGRPVVQPDALAARRGDGVDRRRGSALAHVQTPLGRHPSDRR